MKRDFELILKTEEQKPNMKESELTLTPRMKNSTTLLGETSQVNLYLTLQKPRKSTRRRL